ncbi:hypothetical protein [Streptomyces sp. NPDC053560]|uniref:hypothetical protein n=1 Tax=Streptomyces sp. NPDC053560 TaxID=3365711 RepID=UPI0037D8DC41
MPTRWISGRLAALVAAVAVVLLGVLTLAPSAAANVAVADAPRTVAAPAEPSPKPSENPCDLLSGQAKDLCNERGNNGADDGTSQSPSLGDSSNPLDPIQSLADGFSKAAAWIVGQGANAVSATSNVDFTNASFLKQYALVFAASSVLTLVLWLVAVAKRAIRGVPFTRAFGEAVGYLWLVVFASAFTPLILYTVVGATDAVTEVIADKGASDQFFGAFQKALEKGSGSTGGGPIMQIVVAIVSIFAAGVLWLELVVRMAALYIGALLGTVVYTGFVDRDLWGRVRTWAGVMGAVIAIKPVIAIVLLLASALSSSTSDDIGAVVSGLAIIILAIVASGLLYRFIPGLGDDIASARRSMVSAVSPRQRVPQHSSPAATVRQGISTHSSRGAGPERSSSSAPKQQSAAAHASGGIAAHSSRSAGSGAGAAPAPRRAPEADQQPPRGAGS